MKLSVGGGGEEPVRIPLTAEEVRHPKEGYIMPERTEHDFLSDDMCDMCSPEVAVFRNLVIHWDRLDVGDYAPDVAVVAPVRNRDKNRSQFIVADEGARPLLAIEVVSRSTRRYDRVDKVRDYARVGVQEYVYLDVGSDAARCSVSLPAFVWKRALSCPSVCQMKNEAPFSIREISAGEIGYGWKIPKQATLSHRRMTEQCFAHTRVRRSQVAELRSAIAAYHVTTTHTGQQH